MLCVSSTVFDVQQCCAYPSLWKHFAAYLQGNLALKTSMDMQTPVRVCRAAAMQQRNGHMYRMYSYEGLYLVKALSLCVLWISLVLLVYVGSADH